MKQFLSFVRKEFYHVFRDRKTLLMLFGLPIVQIVLFGFALTNEVKNAKIVIFDYAKDIASQEITQKFEANQNFQLTKSLMNAKQIESAFKKENVKLAIVFPANFYEDLLHLHKAQIQIIADGSDPNTASTLQNYANAIIMDYQMDLLQNQKLPYSINTELRMLYNPELKGATTFVPGIMALVLMLICVLMTAVSIVREKEMGTMEILLVSPFNPFLVIVSKALPYFLLSMVNLTVILVMATTLLDMPIHGSLLLLVAESALLIICALSVGLLISNITKSQQAAMLISMMGMMLPIILFTGFMFPLENMPKPLQLFSNIVPSKWYYIIAKSIMLKGLGIAAIWKETLVLIGMTVLLLFLSLKKFKTRLE
ncbi:ABC transporter permease [Sphingobacterium endophyticum]|uniref:ABC transporter permease n=1 Tax=Sphingobacterium endophyticum TaxID=2546448 RepID=UPI0012E1D535|nr:ABC transporter permease [Sphingobacterium endophyticum]